MTPIYVKTVYSFLSSMVTIDNLVDFAKKNNYSNLCICDDNMYGVMEFIKKCQSNNINPIVGIDINGILLFAKNYDGYKNLLHLNKIKSERDLEINDYKDYSNDLVCFIKYDNELKMELTKIYSDYYIYSSDINNSEYLYIHKTLCLNKNDIDTLKYLNMLRDNKTILDEYEFNNDVCFINYDSDIYNEFFNKCHLELPKYTLNIPDYCKYNDTKGLNSDEYLENLSIIGLNKRLNNKVTVKYKDRLLYELSIIKKMGFSNYFLIVYDYIKYAKMNNILVGPGRGSAAGSLVSFSLGITEVDPLKYDLLFERFLNPSRITMPDIDTDFPDIERDKVIEYCINKYGINKVALITTFTPFGSKMAIRDMGRILNVPLYVIDDLTKKIGNRNLSEALNDIKIKELIQSDNKIKKLYEMSLKIEGIPRHSSIHAAGVIMADMPLDSIIPLTFYDDKYVSCYEAKYLEELGLLKMDFLGIKNLTMISDIINLINKDSKNNLNFNNIQLDDIDTFKIFQNGDTCGIFQFESNGMKDFLRRLKPNSFIDIYNANAFFRPGPSNYIDLYIERRSGKANVDYMDERLKPILKETLGIIVYQEQIMAIANVMASFSMSEADILRRAVSKKKIDEINKFHDKFVDGSINNNYSKELSENVFNMILEFASYGFNKSHSVAYSIISYKMAYLKYHYPLYFYKVLLDNSISDNLKTIELIKECKKKNISVIKPNNNISLDKYVIYYNKIILPLNIINGVSSVNAKKIIEIRKDKFIDIYDFFIKIIENNISKNIITALINSGCLDNFNYNRKTLINNLDNLINYGNLVHDLGSDFVLKPEINIVDDYTNEELIKNEKEIFGFYLSNHPVTYYRDKINGCINTSKVKDYFNKYIKTVLMIDKIKEVTTKKGEKMAFLDCSDEEGSIDVTAFPKVYQELSDIKKGDIVFIEGKIERRNDYAIIVNQIKKL